MKLMDLVSAKSLCSGAMVNFGLVDEIIVPSCIIGLWHSWGLKNRWLAHLLRPCYYFNPRGASKISLVAPEGAFSKGNSEEMQFPQKEL